MKYLKGDSCCGIQYLAAVSSLSVSLRSIFLMYMNAGVA
jgi:hypothetical protein